MTRVLNSAQMREADRVTIDDRGVPSLDLMERAGREVTAAMVSAFPDLRARRVLVLCGKGNNGGDGFVVSRLLRERSVAVRAWLVGPAADVKHDARTNLDRLRALGVEVAEIADLAAWRRYLANLAECDLIVDALFGTGLTTPLDGLPKTVVDDVNASGKPVVAIDLPSGLSADRPEPIGSAIRAALTVTLGAPKLPLVLPPGEGLAGTLVIADIGIPRDVIDAVDGPRLHLLTADAMRAQLKPRPVDSHKGTYGRVAVVAGSRGKTGAAHLAAMAALRSGAGLVTVATPASCLPIVAAMGAEYMTEPLAEDAGGTLAAGAADRILALQADVIAIGPGLGHTGGVSAAVRAVVEESGVPIVLDADGLNVFAGDTARLKAPRRAPIVLTPHPGEMARLTGLSTGHVQARRLEVARDFATAHDVHLVLKGHRTVIATPAADVFINPTGNPGMATGGSGDVLTGTIAAWIAQLRDVAKAATLAVYLHGLAGDLAAADEGQTGMIAGDVVARLGRAVRALAGGGEASFREP